MEFKKAVRRSAKARLALSGPSGSGKTWSALLVAGGLGGSVALIDTEKGSASLYAGLPGIPEFDVLELGAPYSPERFIEALQSAARAGYEVVIVDGITPEWSGVGGCLEINDTLANAKFRGNTWSAWNETTPRHRRFVDAMLTYPGHVIVTMRSKTETAQEEKNGRKTVVKLGMKTEQRDGIEYEFTAVLDLVHSGHYATASKDRTRLWMDRDPSPITLEDGVRLKAWLESGAAPAQAGVEQGLLHAALQAIASAPNKALLRCHFDAAAALANESQDSEALERIRHAANTRRTELVAAMADPLSTDPAIPAVADAATPAPHPEGVTA